MNKKKWDQGVMRAPKAIKDKLPNHFLDKVLIYTTMCVCKIPLQINSFFQTKLEEKT